MSEQQIRAEFEAMGYKVWVKPVDESGRLWSELAAELERFKAEIAWYALYYSYGLGMSNGAALELVQRRVPCPCYGVCLSQFSV